MVFFQWSSTYRMNPYSKNSPHTKVYNICINDAVKRIARREFGTESSNELPEDRRTSEPVEVSLKPGDIEVIIAGFPWFVLHISFSPKLDIITTQCTASRTRPRICSSGQMIVRPTSFCRCSVRSTFCGRYSLFSKTSMDSSTVG